MAHSSHQHTPATGPDPNCSAPADLPKASAPGCGNPSDETVAAETQSAQSTNLEHIEKNSAAPVDAEQSTAEVTDLEGLSRASAQQASGGAAASPAATISAVYERLLRLTDAPKPEGALENVGPLIDVRCAVRDSDANLRDLRAEFSDRTLLMSGVAHEDDRGALHLHPDLVQPGGLWIALRDTAGTVIDLIGAGDALRAAIPALWALTYDQVFLESIEEYSVVYAVPTIHDVILLRSHGMAAVTTIGLTNIKELPSQLLSLIQCQLSTTDQPAKSNVYIERFCIVDGSIAQQRPGHGAELEPVLAQVRQWQAMGVDVDEWRMWRPTVTDLNTLHRIFKSGSLELRDLFFERVDQSTVPVTEQPARRKPSLTELLGRDLDKAAAAADVSDSRRAIRMAIYETFTAPLIKQAEAEAQQNGVAAALKLTFALDIYTDQVGQLDRVNARGAERSDQRSPAAQMDRPHAGLLELAELLHQSHKAPRHAASTVCSLDSLPSYRRIPQV